MVLQYSGSPSAKWYRRMANNAIKLAHQEEYFKTYGTYQGIYFAAPDATAYAMLNDWTPENFASTATEVLQKAAKDQKRRASLKEDLPGRLPAEPNTSVVRLFYRCEPTPVDADPINQSLGRDFMWIYQPEVKQIVDQARALNISVPLPKSLAARLSRFHLLDNVRGLADSFEENQIEKSQFSVALILQRGSQRTYRIDGQYGAERENNDSNYQGKVGVCGTLHGEFDIDVSVFKITRFRALADGQAWGAGSNTWGQVKGRFPLKIAMVEELNPQPFMSPVWVGMPGYTR